MKEDKKCLKAIVDIGEHEDRVITIIKGKFGFKNKSDAINFVIAEYEKKFLGNAINKN